jgi:sterol desaturase/sphingolipid hydroxylase (fatty acid hydroxylase superfamily)/CDGSH-type Zn-finger protein
MEKIITSIGQNDMIFVFGILIVFGLIEGIFGYLSNTKRRKDDVIVEIINFVFLAGLSKPVIGFLTFWLFNTIFPAWKGAWSNLPLWASLVIFLLVDDILQYWYHRWAHEYKWLWKWHRAHHTATEMGLLVSYRQAVYYYFIMPNIYWIGIFIFLGGGVAAGLGIVLKQIIIISSHSLATWDSFFYKRPALMPIMRVLERIFITPAFHHGHHGVSIQDGIGNPNGNFGNMFSIWDQLFGTAKFTHAFPTEYGLPNDPQDNWASQSFYPLIKSDKPNSELSKEYIYEKTTVNEPATVTLTEGVYLYCQCGYSKNQPFCDGSHHGTKFQPMKFTIKKEREYKLCQCKGCAKAPFCDDSHLKMK